MRCPIEHGIAPELPCLREIVGRDACDFGRLELPVQLEELGMRPDVRTVIGDIERDIPDDADAECVAVLFERLPLKVELILQKLPEEIFFVIVRPERFERGALVAAETFFPVNEAPKTVFAVMKSA